MGILLIIFFLWMGYRWGKRNEKKERRESELRMWLRESREERYRKDNKHV